MKTKFHPTDPRDIAGDKYAWIKKLLTQALVVAPPVAPVAVASVVAPITPVAPVAVARPRNALAEMLRQEEKFFNGASRLNFWRNGASVLHVQVSQGCRATKLACHQANVTDEQISDLLIASWGWENVGNNPHYFRPNPSSLVRL